MADISVMNVGGSDYNIKDSTSRTNSTKAMSLSAYYETGNTASQAYSIVGTPINWKGTLYYTKTTVAKGATWVVGTNLTAANNLGKLVRNIKTYVGSDSKLHFVDLTGADTALNFSSGATDLGSGTSISVNLKSTRSDYANLTVDDFIVEVSSGTVNGSSATASSPLNGIYTLNKAYNASTGVFTCSATVRAQYYNVDISKSLTCHAYLNK